MNMACCFGVNFLMGILVWGVPQDEPTPATQTQQDDNVAVAEESPAEIKTEQAANNEGSGPNIVCDQAIFDFGKASNHRSIEHTFVLKNTGELPLVISDVRKTCGCTVARINNKVVPPAGETEVTVKLLLKGRKGKQQKAIIVMSNDPDTPQLRLYMKGVAESVADISPERLFFRGVNSAAATEKTIDIRFKPEYPVSITSLGTSSEQFTASQEVVEDGKLYHLTVRARPQSAVGRYEDTLVIKTDNQEFPILEVPLIFDVVGDLAFSPLKMILTQADVPVTRIIVVSSNKKKEFEIENVEPPNESIKVKVTPLGAYAYRIQLDNMVASQELTGSQIKITTNVAGMKEIVIPCFLIAPARATADPSSARKKTEANE